MSPSAASAMPEPAFAKRPPRLRPLGSLDGLRRRLAADAILGASFLFFVDWRIVAVWLAAAVGLACAEARLASRGPGPVAGRLPLLYLAPAGLAATAAVAGGSAGLLAGLFVAAGLAVHALGDRDARRKAGDAPEVKPAPTPEAAPDPVATPPVARKAPSRPVAAPAASDSGRMMRALLSDLSDLSRLEGARLSLEPTAFDLRVLLAATLRAWKAEARRKGLAFQASGLAQAPRWVEGDAVRIRQILDTLFANALKFTASGSVSLTVQAAPREGGAVDLAFSVMDTGPGMTAEQSATLFDAYDAHEDGVRRPGPGLPRHLARELARLMGGDVTASSAPGLGAVFTFRAPLALADGGAKAVDTRRGLRVLVVDDHAVYRQAFTLVLESVCREVVCAEDGIRALDLLAARSFDLVLMDLSMPKLGGLATTQRLRASSSRSKDVAVIALTASVSDQDRAACLAAGMNGFVSKPVDARELLAAVHAVLSGQEISQAA